MRDDLRIPLDELGGLRGQSIISQLLEIQNCRKQNPRSFDWARTLTCLSPRADGANSAVLNKDDRVLHKISVPISTRNYVAVSYRCDEATGSYCIVSSDGSEETYSRVRDVVFARILQYMEAFGVPAFWIDQEGVDQQDQATLADAVQSMDLVYRCSNHVIGLLDIRAEKQSQLDVLLDVISGSLVLAKRPQLKRHVDYLKARRVLRVLNDLTSDPWWTRRWIFQEEYCSNMTLMIPYDQPLDTSDWDQPSVCIPGQILMSASDLREQITLFCLACLHSAIFETEKEWRTCSKVLGRAKSYKTLLLQNMVFDDGISGRPMSSQILNDISYRYATVQHDTLAVLANCCGYDILLDTDQLESNGGHSLGLSILTLCLLNGEVLWDKRKTSLRAHTINFLKQQAFDEFNPPLNNGKLSFMRKCRFPNVHLLPEGVRTTGHLWRIKQCISPRKLKIHIPDTEFSCPDSDTDMSILTHLSHALRKSYPALSRALYSYATDTPPSHISSDRLQEVFDQTATYLTKAIANNEELFIVQHANQRARYGIFVANFPRTTRCKPSLIFTAMKAAEYSEEVEMYRSPDKYVALTVDAHGWTSDGLRSLSVHGWVNGLVFPGSASEAQVVFRWPQVLREERDDEHVGTGQ